ncbi:MULTISPECIES: LysR family transcriptional regulator [Amycolatopsis]|uniref:LysR family transcriptional regulator n=1 Tax=Amycolatopsis dendrobii TaxID=2760662 RepID=A0A7W3W2A1_9PSEU|nr:MULTISPECIES: LysR family transcriptional regulator [Amycolatopsis]MBB1157531.1 LysR family transcriptional regulator [Amycolatopsis dendrobii]UKD54275.1 LysR family transcriptional regulator [Amycolatopsis sp. FU40]
MPNESLTAQLVPHLCLLATLRSTGNVTRTAEILGVPQPTVSRRLAALGQALGAPLTVPDGRGVRLTRAAELLADAAERALPAVDAGVRLAREEIEPASGRVVLGFLHLLGRSLVPELLRTYREQAPTARFSLVQGSLQDMVDRLVSGDLDLALLAPVVEDERLETVVLDRQPIHLSVPAGHRLAGRRGVRVAELADEPFVLLEPGYGLRRITDDLCAAAGFTPKVAFEGQESDTVRGLVGAGLGVALLPRFEPGSPAGVAEVPLHPPVHRTIGLAWRAGEPLSPAVQAFRDHVLGRTD